MTPTAEQFMQRTRRNGECIEWTGPIKPEGYGSFTIGSRTDGSRRTVQSHRFSYELFNGPIPDGMQVCHACDNRLCVNPAHLWLGSQRDNLQDAIAKGRWSPNGWREVHPEGQLRGSQLYNAKLTEEQVVEIRMLHSQGVRFVKLARRFGVSPSAIRHIVIRRNWTHV